MTFIELAKRVLSEAKEPLTVNEVWDIADKKGYINELNSSGATPIATLGAQLYTNKIFEKIGARPAKFKLKQNVTFTEQIVAAETKTSSTVKYKERDLHEIFVQYAHFFMGLYCKTIFHEKSDKKGKKYNEWVHPDIVGVSFKFESLGREALGILNQVAEPKIGLYSFELKKGKLEFGNLREYFFQAVSNSSWANEGYLVVESLDDEQEFQNELSRLVNSFGIGIIKLDKQNASNSVVVYEAQKRKNLDFEMIDKLAKLNPDFQAFLETIEIDAQGKRVNRQYYDAVMELE
jgi:hypothetical protein